MGRWSVPDSAPISNWPNRYTVHLQEPDLTENRVLLLYLSGYYSVLICLSWGDLLVGVLFSLYTSLFAKTKFTGLSLLSRYSNSKCSDAICSFLPLTFSLTAHPISLHIPLISEFHSNGIFQRTHAVWTRHQPDMLTSSNLGSTVTFQDNLMNYTCFILRS